MKAAAILLICVPLIPISIVVVQKIAKKLLNKYWSIYTYFGDSFLENLQGLTTLKIYQADQQKADEMDVESQNFPPDHDESSDDAAQLNERDGHRGIRRRGGWHGGGGIGISERKPHRVRHALHCAAGERVFPAASSARIILPHRDERHGGE